MLPGAAIFTGPNSFAFGPSTAYPALGKRFGPDTLTTIAVILRHYDHTAVTIRAFNDGVAGKGAAGPEDRAQAVAHALMVDGVPRARIFAQGYGATRRVMATGRRISVPGDRRIEIRITPLARS